MKPGRLKNFRRLNAERDGVRLKRERSLSDSCTGRYASEPGRVEVGTVRVHQAAAPWGSPFSAFFRAKPSRACSTLFSVGETSPAFHRAQTDR